MKKVSFLKTDQWRKPLSQGAIEHAGCFTAPCLCLKPRVIVFLHMRALDKSLVEQLDQSYIHGVQDLIKLTYKYIIYLII